MLADLIQDLLDVSDSEVWTYSQTLRSIAQEMGCSNIQFSRIYELLGSEYSNYTTPTEEEYLHMVPEFRKGLERNLPDGYNVAEEISNNADVTATYRGHKKFPETEHDTKLGRSRADKENAEIAKRMLNRGKVSCNYNWMGHTAATDLKANLFKAFAQAIKKRFPVSVRLSIHPSTDFDKSPLRCCPRITRRP